MFIFKKRMVLAKPREKYISKHLAYGLKAAYIYITIGKEIER